RRRARLRRRRGGLRSPALGRDAPRRGSDRRLRRHGRLHPRRRSLARVVAHLGAFAMSDLVLVEREEPIAVCLLNRPQQLNALSDDLMDELVTTLRDLDADEAFRCIVLGGSERAFAAGADIGELARASAIELYHARRVDRWDAIRSLWTPLIAAVSGYCLGGGCALALSCDLIVASESTRFGQPETSIGVISGAVGA